MEVVWKRRIMNIVLPLSRSKTQDYVNTAYVDFITSAGFNPIIVPQRGNIEKYLSGADGLMLPGGIDIDPIYYRDDNFASMGTDPEKDAFERELLYGALNASIPIFGICRGFQLIIREYMLNRPDITEFLSFEQHIGGHNQVETQQLARNNYQHFVNYIPDFLYGNGVVEVDDMPVNSMHHQCLSVDFKKDDLLGVPGFDVAAWTTRGLKITPTNKNEVVCEAYRITDWGVPILAVQWHPEELKDSALISNFFRSQKVQQGAV